MDNMTQNMKTACNIIWGLAQHQAEIKGNFDMIADLTVSKAAYKSSGKLKDLETFKNDIIQIHTIMVNALKDWKDMETFETLTKKKNKETNNGPMEEPNDKELV